MSFYEDMKIWVNYVHEMNQGGIIYNGLGDWCPPGAIMGKAVTYTHLTLPTNREV